MKFKGSGIMQTHPFSSCDKRGILFGETPSTSIFSSRTNLNTTIKLIYGIIINILLFSKRNYKYADQFPPESGTTVKEVGVGDCSKAEQSNSLHRSAFLCPDLAFPQLVVAGRRSIDWIHLRSFHQNLLVAIMLLITL